MGLWQTIKATERLSARRESLQNIPAGYLLLQQIEDALGRVPLLGGPLLVVAQNGVDHAQPRAQLGPLDRTLAPITPAAPRTATSSAPSLAKDRTPWLPLADSGPQHEPHDVHARISLLGTSLRCSRNHAIEALAHGIKILRVAYFYSAAERRSRGALWPSFALALIAHAAVAIPCCLPIA